MEFFQNFTIISTLNCKFTFQCYCQLQRSVSVQSSQSLNWLLFYFISFWLHIPSNNHHCQSLCIVCSDLHCSISFSFFQDHRHNYLLQTTKLSRNSNGFSYNEPVEISLQSWIWIWLVTRTGRLLHHKSSYMMVKKLRNSLVLYLSHLRWNAPAVRLPHDPISIENLVVGVGDHHSCCKVQS